MNTERKRVSTPLPINEFWNYTNESCGRTSVTDSIQILQFRNAAGLLTTEKWVFVGDVWMRVSVR